MTDEQWKELEKNLVPPFGRAKLLVDGYTVDIVVALTEKMKFGFTVYVEDQIEYYESLLKQWNGEE